MAEYSLSFLRKQESILFSKISGLLLSQRLTGFAGVTPDSVIPVKTGIYLSIFSWIPAYAGMTLRSAIPVKRGIYFKIYLWIPNYIGKTLIRQPHLLKRIEFKIKSTLFSQHLLYQLCVK